LRLKCNGAKTTHRSFRCSNTW